MKRSLLHWVFAALAGSMFFLSQADAEDQGASATIDAVQRVAEGVQIDFSVHGNPDRTYIEGSATATGQFRVQYDAELTLTSEDKFRAFVPISTDNRFFRVQLLAQAETNTLVLPKEARDSFFRAFLPFSPLRFNQVYSSNEFSEVFDEPIEITELAFRLDEEENSGLDTFVSEFAIKLGILRQTMEQIPRDQWIYVPDASTVFTQQVVRLTGIKSEDPQVFQIRVVLQKPFIYDPAVGQLFLEFTASGNTDLAALDEADFPTRRGWVVLPLGNPPLTGAAMIVTEFRHITLSSLRQLTLPANASTE